MKGGREMVRRIWVVLIAAVLTVWVVTSFGSMAMGADVKRLSIATASTGGTWFPIGGGIASIINKYVANVEATAHPSGASLENIRLLEEKNTDLAMVMPDIAYYAVSSLEMYKDKPKARIRGMFSTYPIDLLIITRAETNIHKVGDLRGHTVAFGPPGSGSEKMTKKVLAEYGITYNDLKPVFISAPEQARALKDRSIDAAAYTIGTPGSAFVDFATVRKARIIPMEKEMIDKINKKYPYYYGGVIPANAYPGVGVDAPCLRWIGLVVCREDLSTDLVYGITKAVFSHIDEMHAIHKMAKYMSLEHGTEGMSLPLHPGAEKYFKEKGVLK
jgi:TRAP transporter TAXI family solute receptor